MKKVLIAIVRAHADESSRVSLKQGWKWGSLENFLFGILVLSLVVNPAQGVLIDNFEKEDFSIVAPANDSRISAHLAVDPSHVIGGDRDVWTHAFDDVGSRATLATSPVDDSVVVTANATGSIYWVTFQYDGPGRNAHNLNADFAYGGHGAFQVDVSSVSIALPATIEVFVITNWGEATEALSGAALSVSTPGTLSFPFSSFEQGLDFSDVDSIAFTVKLQTASSIAISEIRTGTIPEPTTLTLLLCGAFTLVGSSTSKQCHS